MTKLHFVPEDIARQRRNLRASYSDARREVIKQQLIKAVEKKNTGDIHKAIAIGADPDALNARQRPVLAVATLNHHMDGVFALLEAGANPYIPVPAAADEKNAVLAKIANLVIPEATPITAPLLAVAIGERRLVRAFITAGIRIPQQWHNAFRALAVEADKTKAPKERKIAHRVDGWLQNSTRLSH